MEKNRDTVTPLRLLCLDIDGTLLNSTHRLPPENRAAVRYAAAKGVAVCLLSARPPQAIEPVWQMLGITGVTAAFGGGLILSGNDCLLDRALDPDTVRQAAAQAVQHEVSLSLYLDTGWYVSAEDIWSCGESAITGLVPTCVVDRLRAWAHPAHKLLCMAEPQQIDALACALQDLGLPMQMVRSKPTYLELLPADVGKDTAMYTLCDALHITSAQVLSIGDQDIDAPLLAASGIGIAVANASPAAKAAARWQTGTNDQAGVAQAIYHWIK